MGSYPNRVYAEAIVDDLQESGIGAIVVPSDECAEPWDVAVPAGDAVCARLVAEGVAGR